MRWRVDRIAVAAVLLVVTAGCASCSSTVSGSAQRAQPGVPDPERNYGYVDNRCGLLTDVSVQQTLGADDITRPYSGAVCQYVLTRAGETTVDVTFEWFQTGTLDRERALADQRGAKLTDTDIERHKAFLARRDTTGAACSATAAAGTGVLSWWVQYRNQSGGDPCRDAGALLTATLRSDL